MIGSTPNSPLFPYTTLFRSGGLGLEGSSYGDMNAVVVGATGPDDKTAQYSTSTGAAKWAVMAPGGAGDPAGRSEEHTSELQSQSNLVCRLLLEKKNNPNEDE